MLYINGTIIQVIFRVSFFTQYNSLEMNLDHCVFWILHLYLFVLQSSIPLNGYIAVIFLITIENEHLVRYLLFNCCFFSLWIILPYPWPHSYFPFLLVLCHMDCKFFFLIWSCLWWCLQLCLYILYSQYTSILTFM